MEKVNLNPNINIINNKELVLSDMAGVISSYNMENNSEISRIEPGACNL